MLLLFRILNKTFITTNTFYIILFVEDRKKRIKRTLICIWWSRKLHEPLYLYGILRARVYIWIIENNLEINIKTKPNQLKDKYKNDEYNKYTDDKYKRYCNIPSQTQGGKWETILSLETRA